VERVLRTRCRKRCNIASTFRESSLDNLGWREWLFSITRTGSLHCHHWTSANRWLAEFPRNAPWKIFCKLTARTPARPRFSWPICARSTSDDRLSTSFAPERSEPAFRLLRRKWNARRRLLGWPYSLDQRRDRPAALEYRKPHRLMW